MKIKIDSRKIEQGDTFLALRGVDHDGHDYTQLAIEKGAKKIIAEEGEYAVETEIVKDTREYLTNYLYTHYYEKIKDMKLIGITGTNGKTTSCYLLYEAFRLLGEKCGYIGTIGFYLDNKVRDLNNTTPDILELYEMLLACKEAGCKYVAMEVSSHALAYGRVDGLRFDYAVFTNLTRDHLDYHKTMENYALAKQNLFHKLKKTGKSLINVDDPYKEYFLLEENNNLTYGFSESDYQITEYTISARGNTFKLQNKEKTYFFTSELIGKYNIYNMTTCIAILLEEGYQNLEAIIEKLEAPLGRMDKIPYKENTIIIDYAHTPDAVEKIICTVKEVALGKVYVVVGCGGNRDKVKRPMMGKIATDLADYVIFTSDNPRWEDPVVILEDIVKPLECENYEVIVNRKEAIKKGVQILSKNDILLLLGKGHENYQVIKGVKTYFDDRQIVLEFM